MKRQESTFKKSFFLENYEADLSKVSTVLSNLKKARNKYQTTPYQLRQKILKAKNEQKVISQQISQQESDSNHNPKEDIQSLQSKINDIQEIIDNLTADKNKILAFDSLINNYTELQRDLNTAIHDIKSLFENFESHQEDIFFSYNTENISFPNFQSLLIAGKSLSDLKPDDDVDPHQYIYFNHRYSSLFKKRFNKYDPQNLRYMPSHEAFSHTFAVEVNKELQKHNYDIFASANDLPELTESSEYFYDVFISQVEKQFSSRHRFCLGYLYRRIQSYYLTYPEIPFQKLLNMMLKSVRKADDYWRREYEQGEKLKKKLKREQRSKNPK